MGLERRQGNSQGRRGFGAGQLLDVAEEKRGAIASGQARERLLDDAPGLVAGETGLGVFDPGVEAPRLEGVLVRLVQALQGPPRAEPLQSLVDGDLVEPGREERLALEVGELAEDLQ